VALGDADSDGDLDAFTTHTTLGNFIWENDGSGGFTSLGSMLGDSAGISVTLGDVDGDEDLDAFIGHFPESGGTRLFWNETPVVAIGENQSPGPSILLRQNSPNPFRTTTTITYSLRQRVLVDLKLYDVRGRELRTLVHEFQDAGTYRMNLNAADLPSGMYLYSLKTADVIRESRRMVILR
jgi:hypothetical protein